MTPGHSVSFAAVSAYALPGWSFVPAEIPSEWNVGPDSLLPAIWYAEPDAVPYGHSPKYALVAVGSDAETPARFMKPVSPEVARHVILGAAGTP